MPNTLIIPRTIKTPFAATKGTFKAVYSKPANSSDATVFVAAQGEVLDAVSKTPATATLKSGILHVNLGAHASSRSAAGLAAEGTTITHG